MRCLVIYAHPVETSLCAALCAEAVAGLRAGGHEVRVIDLHKEGFEPTMSRAERLKYHTRGENEAPVREHLEHLHWAQALIFVYPTWWYGLPAMLKGWLDRVWIPHVTFTLPDDGSPIRGLMQHIECLVGITTSGSSRFWMMLVGNPGRKTIMRGIRAICARRCRKLWLAHYDIDKSTPESRAAFMKRVRAKLAAL